MTEAHIFKQGIHFVGVMFLMNMAKRICGPKKGIQVPPAVKKWRTIIGPLYFKDAQFMPTEMTP